MDIVRKFGIARLAEIVGIIALMVAVGALVVVGVSERAGGAAAVAEPVAVAEAPVMGPAAPVERVVNEVAIPKFASADCFNVYRNGVKIGDCIQPSVDPETGEFYFDDTSAEIKPGTRYTYEISAVNATGESPRVGQGGPYEK